MREQVARQLDCNRLQSEERSGSMLDGSRRRKSKRPGAPPPESKVWRVATVVAATVAAIASTAVLASAGGGGDAKPPQALGNLGVPDMVLYNGKISTVDEDNSVVDAIAIRDGEVLATGSNGSIKKLAKKGTKLVDLRGRRVLPGLIDGHIHGMREGYHCWTQVVRLDLVTSRATALAMYAAKADELDDGRWIWTTSGGWNLGQLDNPTVFTFDELSAAAPKNPLWIQGSGIAGARVNQAALDLLGLAAGSPGVVLGADGKPTGQLAAPATALANAAILAQIDAIGIDGEAKCLKDFIAEANSRGLTAWKDAGGNTAPWGTTGAINDGLHVEEGAMHLYRTSGLNARIAYNAMSGYAGYPRQLEDTRNAVGFLGDDMFRYMGPGEDMMPNDPDYPAFTRYAAGKRLSVETHVGVLDPLLDGFEAGNTVYPINKLKWRIAHPNDGQPTDAQLARANAIGVGWALTFSSVRNGGAGPRYKTVMNSAEHMCLATDAMNVAPWAPFQTLWYVITGQTMLPGVQGVPADQRLTRTEALRHATVECGWFIDQEDRVGSLQPGWHADMIVLSDDYFEVDDADIKDIESLLTVVDGRVVHAAGEFGYLVGDEPILGEAGLGPETDTLSSTLPEAFRSVARKNGTVDRLSVFVENGTTAASLVAGIYSDANGHPGQLLGQGKWSPVTAGAWNTVALPAVPLAKDKPYWIAVQGQGGVLKIRTYSGGQGTENSETGRAGRSDLPQTWRTGQVFKDDGPVSAYALGG
jgi:predicted amidohydrolase YtcJ